MLQVATFAMEGDTGITAMSTAADAILDMVGTVYDTATAHPIMMIPIAAAVIGTAVGIFRALTGQRRRKRG